MKQTKSDILALLPLFMAIFLDVAGIILVLPVLAPLILKENGLVASGTSLLLRDFLYGFSLASFPLFMFLSTPILGDLSDKFGRKKILLLCLIASSISYVVSALGIIFNSLLIFLGGRIFAGLVAGTQPIATAAIIDKSPDPHSKSRNLAWVVFTSSLGLIIGPAIGGITAEKSIVSWFGYDTPFLFAAGLSLINAIFLYFSFKEVFQAKSGQVIQLTKGLGLFMSAFTDKKFRLLSSLFFCFILAWSLYYQTITWFFMEKFHYSVGKLGLFVTFIGVVFALSTSIGMRLVSKYFKQELNIFMVFVLLMAIANIGAAISQGEISQWLWAILVSASNVICFTVSLTIFSNLVGLDSQGWIMGVTGAIGAITWTIGGLIAGPLGYININVPLWTAGFLCLLSFLQMLIYKKR